ncbi:Hypothetical protein, putative [Bodo saltans]|uniref:Uncharacterized protein n=1 Tax=Bodo saltans TaxID=75058 RepID=A0A0S4JCB8_BODSA|nr:Hypothetical protein, putative [Bodo saltans]|eukprot:CUG87836.1 Hypothetical protein, putative [Bodo saltans]
MDSSVDLSSSRSSSDASPRVGPSPTDILQQCASMGVLMRFKHTAELLALGPKETTRALVEIQQGAVLNRFYAAAEDMGLRRERFHMIRTVDELDSILEKVKWALRTVQWNSKRLANICRWILRSIRILQRFTRRYLPKLRRMKASVLKIWTDAMSKMSANLQRQTMEHIRRFRITLQHESFRDEALGLLLDCHVPIDEVRAAIESLWRLRRDDYRSMFRRRQRESRVRQIQHVSSLQAATAHSADAPPPRHLQERHTSTMATKTLTFRTLRLKRIDFDVPQLLFGPENVTLAEICVHHRLLKLRQVQDNIAGYRPSTSDDAAESSPMERVLATSLRVDPFTPHERVMRASMLDVSKRFKVPVTYLHSLLTIDSTTQWFLLYLIRQLQRGGSTTSQGHLPEAMQGHWDHAVHIVGKWGATAGCTPKQPSTAAGDRRRPSTADPRRRATVSHTLSTTAAVTSPRPTSAKRDPPTALSLGGVPRVSVRRVSPARSPARSPLNLKSNFDTTTTPSHAVQGASANQPSDLGVTALSPRSAQWARAVSPYSQGLRSPMDEVEMQNGADGELPVTAAESFWTEALAHHKGSVERARVQLKQRAAALSAKVSPRGLRPVSPPTPKQPQSPRIRWQPPANKPLYRPIPTHTKPPALPTLETILTSRRLAVRDDAAAVAPPPPLLRPMSAPAGPHKRRRF